jgi:hypothetical protein
VSAVLNSPQSLVTELASPGQQCQVILARGFDHPLPNPASAFVDSDDGVGPLVRVDAEYQHVDVSSLSAWMTSHPLVGISSSRRLPRS